MPGPDELDQTETDQVSGVDVVDGVLTFRRKDGSSETYDALAALPIVDPDTAGALWNDDGTVMVSDPSDVFVASLPTSNPHVNGQLWNNAGAVMMSTGP